MPLLSKALAELSLAHLKLVLTYFLEEESNYEINVGHFNSSHFVMFLLKKETTSLDFSDESC